MSNNIDRRVVEMQFNNKDFERNASQSMATIDNLKQKLDFSGSSKAFKDFEQSTSQSMGVLNTVVTVAAKPFNALEEIAKGALRRIGEDVADYSKKLLKSFTIDNLSAGWDKFGEETKAVSTLKAQGFELEKIEEQIELLNWFTDETSYNFTAMVQEIGKFTASGQDLDNSVTAMMGIANWAALSGQNAQKASSAMYQLSQAMSKGALKYDDWKSIQNASMDTIQFRRMAASMAAAHGSLVELGDDMYRLVQEGKNGLPEVSEEIISLNDLFTSDYLTRKAWLDTDVMMSTFTAYGKASQSLKAIVDSEVEDIGTASEAMIRIRQDANKAIEEAAAAGETLSKDDAIKKVTFNLLKQSDAVNDYITNVKEAEGRTIDYDQAIKELGYDIDEFSLDALEAAQAARTWEDVVDSVKDAVSTKWSKSFKNIFGDADEAKDLWTRLANDFYEMFAESGNLRNEMLDIWKEMGGRDLIFSTDENNLGAILQVLNAIKSIFGLIKQAANEVFYGTSDDMEVARIKAENLYNATKAIAEWLKKIVASLQDLDKELEDEDSEASKLKRTFKGLFAIFDIFKIILSEAFNAVKELFGALFNNDTTNGFLGLTANVGDVIVAFRDWIKESGVFRVIFGTISGAIVNVVNGIKAFIDWVKSIPEVANGIEFVEDLFNKLKENITDFYNSMIGKNPVEIFWAFVDAVKNSNILKVIQTFFDSIVNSVVGFWNSITSITSSLGLAEIKLEDIFNNIKEFFENFTINDAVMIAIGIGIFMFVKKIFQTVKMVGGLIEAFTLFSNTIKSFFSGIKKSLKAHAILALAGSILILVGAIAILAQLDIVKMWSALGVLSGLIVVVSALLIVVSKAKNVNRVAFAVAGLSAAFMFLSLALSTIANSNIENCSKALFVLAFLSTWIILISSVATKLLSKKANIKTIIGFSIELLAVGVTMLLMAEAAKKIAELDVDNLDQVGSVMLSIAKALGIMLIASSLVRKGAAGAILASVISLFLMADVIKKLAKLDSVEATKGLLLVQDIFNMYGKTLMMIGLGSLGRGLKGAGSTIAALVASVWALIGAVAIFGIIPYNVIEQGKKTIEGLISMMTVFLVLAGIISRIASADALKASGTMLLKLAASLLIVTSALTALSVVAYFTPDGLWQAFDVMVAMTALFAVIVGVSKLAEKSSKSLGAIVASLVVISSAIIALTYMDTGKAIEAAISLAIVIAAMTVAIGVSKLADQDASKNILSLSIAVIMLGEVLVLMQQYNVSDPIEKAIAIGVFLSAFTGSLALISKFASGMTATWKELGKVLAVLGILTVIATALSWALSLIENVDPVRAFANSLVIANLMGVMTGILIMLTKFGSFAGGALASMGIIAGTVAGLGLVLYLMNDLDPVNCILTATAIVIALTGVAGMLATTILVGKFAPMATAGLTVLAEFLLGLTGFMGLFGGLMHIPGFESSMENGIKFFSILGQAIGAFFGGIAGGFSASQLSAVGKGMASFYEDMQTISDVDRLREMVDIANTFGTLGKNLAGIQNTEGLAKIFSELAGISDDLVKIATEFNSLNIDSAKVESVTNIGRMLSGLAETLPKHNGVVQWFMGDTDLASFGKELVAFVSSMKGLENVLGEIGNIDTAKVDTIVNIGRMFSGLENNMPKHDGVVQWFMGDTDLPVFGREIVAFAVSMKGLENVLDEIGNINAEKVELMVNIGQMFSGLANNLPKHGGVVQWFSGETDFPTFGREIVAFAKSMGGLAEVLSENGDIDEDAVDAAVNCGYMFSGLANSLPSSGGFLEVFTGHKESLSEFGENIKNLGTGIKEFSDTISGNGGLDADAMDTATRAIDVLSVLEQGLPQTKGVFGWFTGGDVDIKGFTESMPKLAEAVRDFSNELVKDGGINDSAVTAGAETLSALASMSNIVGLPNFGPITEQLIPMAENLKKYSKILDKDGGFSSKSMKEVVTAVTSLADLEKSIKAVNFNKTGEAFSRIDGIVATLAKVSNLDSEKIKAFSETMTNFSKEGFVTFLEAMSSETSSIEKGALAIIDSFIAGVDSKENEFAKVFGDIAEAGIKAIRAKADDFESLGTDISDDIMAGMNNKINDKETGIGSIFGNLGLSSEGGGNSMVSGLLGNLTGSLKSEDATKMLDSSGWDLTNGLTKGMESCVFKKTFGDLIFKKSNGFKLPDVSKLLSGNNGVGNDIMGMLSTGMTNFDFSSVATSITGNISTSFSSDDVTKQLNETGANATQGFIDGALSKELDVKKCGEDIAKAYKTGIETALDMNSPSKEMKKDGIYAAQGFLLGLSETNSKIVELVKNNTKQIGESVVKGFSEGTKSFGESAESHSRRIGERATKGFSEGFGDWRDVVATNLKNLEESATNENQLKITPVIDRNAIPIFRNEVRDVLSTKTTFDLSGSIMSHIDDMNNRINITVDNSSMDKTMNELITNVKKLGERIDQMKVVLDTGALVGEISAPMDSALGKRAYMKWRG